MINLSIDRIYIANFKGIHDCEIILSGDSAVIRGDNGTGKSTVFDAYLWLLTGKDSSGKANFQVKPVGVTGEEIHDLETLVEINFLTGAGSLTLSKKYYEIWESGVLKSHSTDYRIDGIPSKKKDFDRKIEDTFSKTDPRILSDPLFFSSMPWAERRSILISLSGEFDDQKVFGSSELLSRLQEILSGHTPENHRKKIKEDLKGFQRELSQIPARISELSSMEPTDFDPDELDRARKNKIFEENKLGAVRNNAQVTDGLLEINELKKKLNRINGEHGQQSHADNLELSRLFHEKIDRENKIETIRKSITYADGKIAELKELVSLKRSEWMAKNIENASICLSCGQDIPKEKIAENKKIALAAISKEGKEIAERIKTLDEEKNRLTAEIKTIFAKIEKIEKEIETRNRFIQEEKSKFDGATEAIEIEIAETQKNIDQIESGRADVVKTLEDRIAVADIKIQDLLERKAKMDAFKGSAKRIEELEALEKYLSGKIGSIEEELFLIDEFEREKVRLLEEAINSQFNIAKFKMFAHLLNGGIEPCCEVLCDGVPFLKGLNTGARVCVGIDIISTLSSFYDVHLPVFVDSAESVTQIPSTGGQQIRLVVDALFKKLEVERNKKNVE